MYSNTSGYANIALGFQSLYSNSSGHHNTASGCQALYFNTTGYSNVADGYRALYSCIEGYSNTAIGHYASNANTAGICNTAIGRETLTSNEANSRSTAVGYRALHNADDREEGRETYNTAVGYKALHGGSIPANNTGRYNAAIGDEAMFTNSSGHHNTAIGCQSLYSITIGYADVANGYQAMYSNTEGQSNIAIGYQALDQNVTHDYSTAIGVHACSNTDGGSNTCVGYASGDYYNFANSTFVGMNAYPAGDGYTNCMALGYNSRLGASNRAVIGNSSVNSIGGYANWTNFSDGRYKKNIRENVPGLEFILQLRPIAYTLDIALLDDDINTNIFLTLREGEPLWEESPEDIASREAKEKIVYTGFIAQEVEATAQSIGYDFSGVDVPQHANDHYGLRYAAFVVPLVRAVQEQQAIIERLQSEIETLREEVKQLMQSSNP